MHEIFSNQRVMQRKQAGSLSSLVTELTKIGTWLVSN